MVLLLLLLQLLLVLLVLLLQLVKFHGCSNVVVAVEWFYPAVNVIV